MVLANSLPGDSVVVEPVAQPTRTCATTVSAIAEASTDLSENLDFITLPQNWKSDTATTGRLSA
jgi:hypothetical protein